jgi:uncharacterized membrane protein YsdA (DUF1294 family)/cold shock CspA family protein
MPTPASSAAAPSPASVRFSGKVVEWHRAKGYGFADDGRRRVFVHIRDFAECHATPRVGDALTYSLGTDKQGRPCAKDVHPPNDGGRLLLRHFVLLALLVATPVVAVSRLAAPGALAAMSVVAVLASVFTFAFYAWDKHRARTGAWRISERTLHFWELIGGWPGAFLAQRKYRHKANKPAYLFVFWLIVAAHNYAALDWQLDWRLAHSATETLRSWLGSVSSDSPAPRSKVY